MDNKLFEFKVVIFFQDGTTSTVVTHDTDETADNVLDISDGCYALRHFDIDLVETGQTIYPIVHNIKEITTTRKEITND